MYISTKNAVPQSETSSLFFRERERKKREAEEVGDKEVSSSTSNMDTPPRDGNFCHVVIVKSCVNKQTGSWLATQECTTNQEPGKQIDPTLDDDSNS